MAAGQAGATAGGHAVGAVPVRVRLGNEEAQARMDERFALSGLRPCLPDQDRKQRTPWRNSLLGWERRMKKIYHEGTKTPRRNILCFPLCLRASVVSVSNA